MSEAASSNRERWIAAALGVALAVALAWIFNAGLVDDAFTGLRHSKNLARGFGPVFNPGERSEGYTSILWTLIPALFGLFTENLPGVALALSLLSASALVFALLAFAPEADSRAGRLEAAALALGIVALPGCFYWAASGMDSVLFAALVAALAASAARDLGSDAPQVSRCTLALMVLASLTRMEALLLAAVFGACMTLRHGKLDRAWLRGTALPFGVLALVWALITGARLAYFGELLPNTYYAKVVPVPGYRLHYGLRNVEHWATLHAPLLLLAAGALALALRRKLLKPLPALFPVLLFAVYCGYVVWVGSDHFPMFRFLLPATALAFVMLQTSRAALFPVLSSGSRMLARSAFVAALTLSAVLSYRADGIDMTKEAQLPLHWRRIGEWLRDHTPPDTLVATIPVGAIGYYSERRIVDMLGITDRTIAHRGGFHSGALPAHGRYHADYVFAREPDLVIYGSSAIRIVNGLTDPAAVANEQISKQYGFALYDFVNDPRCAERYEHVIALLPGGGYAEMQMKKGFDPGYPVQRVPANATRGR